MTTQTIVQLHRLCKSYRESEARHLIFKNVDLEVAQGEFVVLLGRSGSGKSTLLNLIGGIDRPDSGEVVVGGVKLAGMSERQRTLFRRHRIGLVFQAFNLIPTLTVAENLLLPLELIGRVGARAKADVLALLSRLELQDRIDSYPDRLSGGEQQRVAIARALIHDPEVILADEPTGNLDLETGQHILRLFDEWVQKAGKTLIMATHSREVLGRADRIVSLHQHGLTLET